MIKKITANNWYLLSVLAILLVAGIIRFFKLGIIPHGMTWDEAAIGYNGFAVISTRRDEWLNFLPVSFMSFGDYKAPMAIYINGISTFLFGLNLVAVRLPFALFSILSVAGIIVLTKELFMNNKYGKQYSLLAGFFLTTSSWHIHFSRVGFESGIAVCFFIWAVYFFLLSKRSEFKQKVASYFSIILFAASIYTYHSAKITVPVIGLLLLILFFKEIQKNFQRLFLPIVVFFLLLIPFIKDSIYGEGLTRAGVTIFTSDLTIYQKFLYVLKSFFLHLSPNFLLLGETTTLRHGTGYLGVLFITTFFLIVAGLICLIKSENRENIKELILFLGVIFAGILPAAVAMEVPHSNRALLSLPGFIILAVYGFEYFIKLIKGTKLNKKILGTHNEQNIVVRSFIGTILLIHCIFLISYLNYYFTEFARRSTADFNDGYIEVFEIAEKYEKGDGVDQVDKIIFTSKYGQPYIYAIFVRQTNPIWYRSGSLVKYEFYDTITIHDLNRHNALVVGSGSDDLPIEKADHIVYGADGSIRFQIYRTKME